MSLFLMASVLPFFFSRTAAARPIMTGPSEAPRHCRGGARREGDWWLTAAHQHHRSRCCSEWNKMVQHRRTARKRVSKAMLPWQNPKRVHRLQRTKGSKVTRKVLDAKGGVARYRPAGARGGGRRRMLRGRRPRRRSPARRRAPGTRRMANTRPPFFCAWSHFWSRYFCLGRWSHWIFISDHVRAAPVSPLLFLSSPVKCIF